MTASRRLGLACLAILGTLFRMASNASILGKLSGASFGIQEVIQLNETTDRHRPEKNKTAPTLLLPGMDLVPVRVLYDYILDHSEYQLAKEWEACSSIRKGEQRTPLDGSRLGDQHVLCSKLQNRKFLVAEYMCPHQAGNRLHAFLNGILWAIVTDRTFLWRYLDKPVCESLRESDDINPAVCNTTTRKEDSCDHILKLSDWIPSFDKWSSTLTLPTAVKMDVFGGMDLANYTTMDAENTPKLIRVGQQRLTRTAQNLQLHLLDKSRAAKLQSQGEMFLYGMLFESTFQFRDSVLPDPSKVTNHSLVRTVAVHSRHASVSDTGDDIQAEMDCLERMFQDLDGPCAVYVMSDRIQTVSLLQDFVSKLNCTPITADHREGIRHSHSEEHGPYAGTGFFEDLALASNARYGFITPQRTKAGKRTALRSSSALLLELIVYRSKVEGKRSLIKKCR